MRNAELGVSSEDRPFQAGRQFATTREETKGLLDYLERVMQELGLGDTSLIGEQQPPQQSDTTPEYCFRQKGDMWEVRFGKENGSFEARKGFGIIARLLQFPNSQKPISALDLQGCDSLRAGTSHTQQPRLDNEAIAKYKERLDEIEVEIEAANKREDLAEAERLDREKEQILEEFRPALNIRGQSRSLGPSSNAEKARVAVRRNLDRAYDRLEGATPPLPALAGHLRESIRTEGGAYAYRPPTPLNWDLG
ncbi:MAG: hypothetical protein JSU86_03150 [Phycisphaerales bacterium]|nr:MAG: hypothetical protein JSU86_03150 [Phycisphaerales bacterium]